MKIHSLYSHLGGHEAIRLHHPLTWRNLSRCLHSVTSVDNPNEVESRRFAHRELYRVFENGSWNAPVEGACTYPYFLQERVGVQVSLGPARVEFVQLIAPHLAFYACGQIDIAIEVLPVKVADSVFHSNGPYYEDVFQDLARQGRGVPAVPLVLVGVVA